MAESEEKFKQFQSSITLPKIASDKVKNFLFVMSPFPEKVNEVYKNLFEDTLSKLVQDQIKDYHTEREGGTMTLQRWRAIIQKLEESKLSATNHSEMSEFLSDKPVLKKFYDILVNVQQQASTVKEWTPLQLCKAYLTIYQESFLELWKDCITDTRYDTKKALTSYTRANPEPDELTLIQIMSHFT